MTTVLAIEGLKKYFPSRGGLLGGDGRVKAVDGVSFTLGQGETLALVGESGSGKSTVGKLILRLLDPTEGRIRLDGEAIEQLSPDRLRPLRRKMQIVFQDPYSSLDPRMRVRDILAEPLRNFGLGRTAAEIDERVAALLELVRLPAAAMRRYPHEFSGGQRQRIGIARALAPEPRLLVCDEAVSALDVSVKASIVNLLAELQDRLGLAMLFISHDLAIVERLTHRVAVMYLGRIVEIADRRTLFAMPRHPYTEALLSAVPVPDPAARRGRIVLAGEIPSPRNLPTGCRFHTRCPYAFERCRGEEPELRPAAEAGHAVACHLDGLPSAGSAAAAVPAPAN